MNQVREEKEEKMKQVEGEKEEYDIEEEKDDQVRQEKKAKRKEVGGRVEERER